MAHTAAALSDTTSVTSPTPFSPFSSAYSVSSEATVVSEGQADLGAFQSVFFALSQLQLHHQHHPRSPRSNAAATPIRNDDSSDDDNDDDHDDDQDTNPGFTRSTTPSLFPVSPLNLDGTVSRSSVHPSNPPSRSQLTHTSEGTSGSTDEAVASDIVLAAAGSSSEAAEEGDEESLALTSPNSHPSSDSASIPDDFAAATFPDDEGRRWMYAESPYDPSFRPSASSEDSDGSPRQLVLLDDGPNQGGDEGTSPSLGDMEAAFAFFAAERAKLVKQLEASKSGTPITLAPSLPIITRKNKRGGKGHRKNKSSEGGENLIFRIAGSQPTLPESDEASLDASPSGIVPSAPITISSSSPDDHTFPARKNQQRRGVLPRPPKQNNKSNRSNNSGSSGSLSLAAAILNPALSSQSHILSNNHNKRNRHANHRHTRSLPIDPQTVASIHQQLQPPTAPTLKVDEADRIRQLARRLSFQFPFDTPYLRRVMQNPQGVLGLRSHATPSSDDALVAEGFFDPVYGADGHLAATGSGSLAATSSALLYVFIDHSNILVGFLEWLKKQGITNKQTNGKPKLSHSALALLIERGRRCLRKVLVASSPLYQSLDEMAGMGYQISVLQRVEIKEGSSRASRNGSGHSRSSSFNSTPNRKNGKGNKANRTTSPNNNNNNGNNNNNIGSSTESDSNGQQKPKPQAPQPSFPARLMNARRAGQHHRRNSSTDAAFITPSNSSTSLGQIQEGSGILGPSTPSSRPRFREEAVDELLQLKLLQTLLDTPAPPPLGSTIVLASGDAAKSQFNPEGFLGCVRKAVDRGWNVEVVGWDEGRSRAYADLANEVNARGVGGMLNIISLDRWGKDLLENLVN